MTPRRATRASDAFRLGILAGARLVANHGLGPILDGLGLIHPIFSYCGRITIAFTACCAMLPDPRYYEDCLRASSEELRAATVGQ